MDLSSLTLGEIIGAIGVISALVLAYQKVTEPVNSFKKRVEDLEDHAYTDNERLKTLEADTRMILKATRVLVAHSVDNNHTGELKKTQEEIDNYLINK